MYFYKTLICALGLLSGHTGLAHPLEPRQAPSSSDSQRDATTTRPVPPAAAAPDLALPAPPSSSGPNGFPGTQAAGGTPSTTSATQGAPVAPEQQPTLAAPEGSAAQASPQIPSLPESPTQPAGASAPLGVAPTGAAPQTAPLGVEPQAAPLAAAPQAAPQGAAAPKAPAASEPATPAAPAPAGSASTAELQKSIGNIDKSIAATQAALKNFEGGTLGGLVDLVKVNSGTQDLGKVLEETTKLASMQGPLNSQDSGVVGIQFLQVQPKITGFLAMLAQKRPEFDKAGYGILDVTSLIHDELGIQKESATKLGAALVKVLDPIFQPIARMIVEQIQGNFTATVENFAGRAGKITIPTEAVPNLTALLDKVGKALGVAGADAAPAPATPAAPAGGGSKEAGGPLAAAGGQQQLQPLSTAAGPSLMVPQTDYRQLGPGENDLTGIPLPVLAVLKFYRVI